MKILSRLIVATAIIGTWALAPVKQDDAPRIALPAKDRSVIEKYLGRGVVGRSVPAQKIQNPAEFLNLEDGVRLKYRVVYGDLRDQTMVTELRELSRTDDTVTRWKFSDGINQVMYGRVSADGSLEIYSSESHDEGVISRYAPAEPVLLNGMKPGQIVTRRINVSVFDLADPSDKEHSGYLDLEYSYIGAYEVNVPAGRFKAALLRWRYKGKVGPAKVEDNQYWFVTPGVGPVAMVQRTDVSAFLVYQDHSKIAAVLVE